MEFNDETCTPTSIYAAYSVSIAPKNLNLAIETGHWTYPEKTGKLTKLLLGKLKEQ
jgi:cephalosporin-C deacetylase-like acetyl esterase